MRFSTLCISVGLVVALPARRLLGAAPASAPAALHVSGALHIATPVHIPAPVPVHVPGHIPQPFPPVHVEDCSAFQNCWDCLSDNLCLWDPNALGGGECKPSSQCDFTVALRVPAHLHALAAAPPATACVRDIGQCGIQNFNGAPLNPNPQRGAGCTNSGQCGYGQYCVDCTQCRGTQCSHRCGTFGSVSGYCTSASLCPINQDSIDNYCPSSTPIITPSNCLHQDCFSCASATGCVWSGSFCYVSSWPCSNPGCANYPSQCGVSPLPGNCAYNDCFSCASGLGCAWSGSFCYLSNSPCTTPGCANYPNQCPVFGSGGPAEASGEPLPPVGPSSVESSGEPQSSGEPPVSSFESSIG